MSSALLAQIETHLKQLAHETDAVKQSEKFRQYLDTMARFWKYSYRNQLLICHQMPTATRVAGYNTWRTLGRQVKRGSKAIKILAPSTRKEIHPDPETGKDEEMELVMFFPVNVFDISQTEGTPLPTVEITLDGDTYKDFLWHLLRFCDRHQILVNFRDLGINGVYGYSKGGSIAVSSRETVNTQVNTIIHEIAHELLHQGENTLGRRDKEIQAESVAHVVMRHFGLSGKSFNYLALWNADHRRIMASLQDIAVAAREIIEFLERHLMPVRRGD